MTSSSGLFQSIPAFSYGAVPKIWNQRVSDHLASVYRILGGMVGAAAFGIYYQITIGMNNILATLAVFGLVFAFTVAKNRSRRLGFLLGFSFFSGVLLGPLVNLAFAIEPRLPFAALAGAGAVFFSCSVIALVAPRKEYFAALSFISSLLLSVAIMRLLRYIPGLGGLPIPLSYQGEIVMGLLLFSIYVIVDTMRCVSSVISGTIKDPLDEALTFYLRFSRIFVKILVLLIRKEGRKKEEKKKRRN